VEVLAAMALATAIALLRRSWPATAALAALWFAVCFVSLGFLFMAIPGILLAAAVALRWRLGLLGGIAILLLAAAVWAIGGLGTFVLRGDLPLFWLLYAGFLAGFAALARNRPPWKEAAASASGRPATSGRDRRPADRRRRPLTTSASRLGPYRSSTPPGATGVPACGESSTIRK